jgi:hypothetical protein
MMSRRESASGSVSHQPRLDACQSGAAASSGPTTATRRGSTLSPPTSSTRAPSESGDDAQSALSPAQDLRAQRDPETASPYASSTAGSYPTGPVAGSETDL